MTSTIIAAQPGWLAAIIKADAAPTVWPVLAWAIRQENPGAVHYLVKPITLDERTDHWGSRPNQMLVDPNGRFHSCYHNTKKQIFETETEAIAWLKDKDQQERLDAAREADEKEENDEPIF